jgi:hypothetical protein
MSIVAAATPYSDSFTVHGQLKLTDAPRAKIWLFDEKTGPCIATPATIRMLLE